MADENHLQILKTGVTVWNQWRSENPDIKPDLLNADIRARFRRLDGTKVTNILDLVNVNFSSANLSGADLTNQSLTGADLSGTDLSDADLDSASLGGANFKNALLARTNLSFAYLGHANLTNSKLFATDFTHAKLSYTDFTTAEISGCKFGDVDLSLTKGLETVIHRGPSSVGIDTIYNSNGHIPELFLIGVGVPDSFIIHSSSFVHQALQFHSCFISYSSKDDEFAKHLYSRMREEHLRVWFAPEDIKGGEKLHEQINRAIQIYDRLLLILSDNSLQSEWVMTEIRRARQTETKEKRRKLFPIRLVNMDTIREWECFDADTGKDLAVEVREYFIPDFSNWRVEGAFEETFKRLLLDLKAGEKQSHVNQENKSSGNLFRAFEKSIIQMDD